MKIPEGVRRCEKVPDAECHGCKLQTEDHTVNFSFPVADNSTSDNVAYLKVCLKDWAKYNKNIIKKEETTMTMEEPKETTAGKVDLIVDGKVIPPKKARDDLHVNIIIKGDKILLGVKADDCDPKMTTLTGTLQNALERVPTYVAECNAQWDVAAHNPKAPEPPKPPPPPPRPVTTSSSKPAAPVPVKAQPNFF